MGVRGGFGVGGGGGPLMLVCPRVGTASPPLPSAACLRVFAALPRQQGLPLCSPSHHHDSNVFWNRWSSEAVAKPKTQLPVAPKMFYTLVVKQRIGSAESVRPLAQAEGGYLKIQDSRTLFITCSQEVQ